MNSPDSRSTFSVCPRTPSPSPAPTPSGAPSEIAKPDRTSPWAAISPSAQTHSTTHPRTYTSPPIDPTHHPYSVPALSVSARGVFVNYNTIQDFKAADKAALFNTVADEVRISHRPVARLTCALDVDQHRAQGPLETQPIPAHHLCRPQEIPILLLVRLPCLRRQACLGDRRRRLEVCRGAALCNSGNIYPTRRRSSNPSYSLHRSSTHSMQTRNRISSSI